MTKPKCPEKEVEKAVERLAAWLLPGLPTLLLIEDPRVGRVRAYCVNRGHVQAILTKTIAVALGLKHRNGALIRPPKPLDLANQIARLLKGTLRVQVLSACTAHDECPETSFVFEFETPLTWR